MSYVVRSAGNVSPLAAPLRTTLGSVVPDVPLSGVRTLDEIVGASTQLSRLVSWLAVIFGALAAVLAMLGVYSVLSYAVAQRMREFAIRAAIGAPRRRLVSLVLREGAVLSAIGIAGGLLIAWQFSALLGNLLFGIGAREPMVFAGAAAVLAFVAGAGYLIPAIRAARAEPMSVLRGE
jgi:ABC-type antimicrobial peptide transport system permease subunit